MAAKINDCSDQSEVLCANRSSKPMLSCGEAFDVRSWPQGIMCPIAAIGAAAEPTLGPVICWLVSRT